VEALPVILESMRLSLAVTAVLVAFGVSVTTLMLYRQTRILCDVSKQLADSEAVRRRVQPEFRKTR
jgi:hypothetical protein